MTLTLVGLNGGGLAAQNLSPATESQSYGNLSQQELRFLIGIFATYTNLRDGVQASTDPETQALGLNKYLGEFEDARSQSLKFIDDASNQCQRFINLYNNVGLQTAMHYGQYLHNQGLDFDTKTNIEARLRILNMLETALFSLVVMGAEGGRSSLDLNNNTPCMARDKRAHWANSMFRAHVSLQSLQLAVFGQPAADVPNHELSAIQAVDRRYQLQADVLRGGMITAESVGAILIWEKWISPYLGGIVGGIKVAPLGRFSTFVIAGTYGMGWVMVDGLLNHYLPFMVRNDEVTDEQTLSSWERLVTLSEHFVDSPLNSPPLYVAYLKMMEDLRAQQIQSFIEANKEIFDQAEHNYGSVDAALRKLKEVYDHEQLIRPSSPYAEPDVTARAGGPRQ